MTFNRKDFVRLHGEWALSGRHHSGIIIVTRQLMPVSFIVSRLAVLQMERDTEAMRDAILFINATGLS